MRCLEILDEAECVETRRLVVASRNFWVQRGPLPFFTLGAATYLDIVADDRHDYARLAGKLNPLLSARFGWLHDRVFRALETALGDAVMPAPGLALPGFHVFLAHPAFTQPLASVHLDLQYGKHPWAALGRPNFDTPISFTLAVTLPAAGGGLNVWPQGIDDTRRLTDLDMAALIQRQAPHYLPYSAGSLVVHDGHLVHQIAPPAQLTPGDERITLQGHALNCGGCWYAYW